MRAVLGTWQRRPAGLKVPRFAEGERVRLKSNAWMTKLWRYNARNDARSTREGTVFAVARESRYKVYVVWDGTKSPQPINVGALEEAL